MDRKDLEWARGELAQRFPGYRELLRVVRFVETKSLPFPMAVDDTWKIYYNPDLDWDREFVLGGLMHEIKHILQDHFWRREDFKFAHPGELPDDRPSSFWLVATDAEINDDLAAMKLKLPEECVDGAKLGLKPGGLCESYYWQLKRDHPELEQEVVIGFAGLGSGEEGDEEGQGGGSGEDEGEQDSQGGGSGKVRVCGAGTPGRKPWEYQGDGDLTEEQKDAIMSKMPHVGQGSEKGRYQKVWQLISERKLREQNAENRRLWVRRMREEVVRYLNSRTGRGYATPSRRTLDPALILPGTTVGKPKIAVLGDTSGSIGMNSVAQMLLIVNDFIGTGVGIRVFTCDTTAGEVKPGQDPVSTDGGTDMPEGLRYVMRHAPDTELCLLISDGETHWGDESDPVQFMKPKGYLDGIRGMWREADQGRVIRVPFPVVMFTWAYALPGSLGRTLKMPPLVGM